MDTAERSPRRRYLLESVSILMEDFGISLMRRDNNIRLIDDILLPKTASRPASTVSLTMPHDVQLAGAFFGEQDRLR